MQETLTIHVEGPPKRGKTWVLAETVYAAQQAAKKYGVEVSFEPTHDEQMLKQYLHNLQTEYANQA